MPLLDLECDCGAQVRDRLLPSYRAAVESPETCPDCGQAMKVAEVYRVSFSEFKPFRTASFSEDGKEIEVSDRSQLRSLLKEHQMFERGDSDSRYFGSDPKSVPTFAEVCKHGRGGISEKTKKMIKAGLVGAVDAKQWGEMRLQDKATLSGRRTKIKMSERDRAQIHKLKTSGGMELLAR